MIARLAKTRLHLKYVTRCDTFRRKSNVVDIISAQCRDISVARTYELNADVMIQQEVNEDILSQMLPRRADLEVNTHCAQFRHQIFEDVRNGNNV